MLGVTGSIPATVSSFINGRGHLASYNCCEEGKPRVMSVVSDSETQTLT